VTTRKKALPQLAGLNSESLDMAENFVYNAEPVRLAREAAIDAGTPVLSNGACALLTFMARSIEAKSVVEIGTGSGVSGLALLDGMTADGVLTSIDVMRTGRLRPVAPTPARVCRHSVSV